MTALTPRCLAVIWQVETYTWSMGLQGPCNQGTPEFSLSENPSGEGSTKETESICPFIHLPTHLPLYPSILHTH